MKTKKLLSNEHGRQLAQLQIFSSFICVLLVLSLLLAGIGVPFSHNAFASGNQVQLWKSGNISYTGGSWNAHIFNANDGEGTCIAYCVEPSKSSPADGTYSKTATNCPSGRNDELRADLWFGYKGPGFDPRMWPSANWDGNPMRDEDYYLSTHILLADTFISNGYAATYGASASFRNWLAWNILGFNINTGEVSNPNAIGRQAKARLGEVPANFETYQTSSGNSQTIATFSAYKPYGTLKLQKQSANLSLTKVNPCYSFKGISYGVYSDISCSEASDTGYRLVLDETGFAHIDEIRAGTYYVREIESSLAGTGFAYDATTYPCTVRSGEASWVHDTSNGEEAVSDAPISRRVDVLLKKHDILTQSNAPSSDADLSSAFFEIRYYANLDGNASGDARYIWIFKTDSEGKIDLSNGFEDAFVSGDPLFLDVARKHVVFPLGTYSIREMLPPASYEPQPTSAPIVFTIVATGTGEHDAESPDFPLEGFLIDEPPVRHDISFVKRDLDTRAPMAGIPFLISRIARNGTTIEQHVAVTDENGFFSSSADKAPHSHMTNGNDKALVIQDNGHFVVREDQLDPSCGIWFGVANDGAWTTPNDDFGAFPDSMTTKYIFEELPVKANEGRALVEFKAYVHGSKHSVIDLGTVDNATPTLATIACDAVDGDKIVSRASDARIIDTLSYTGLEAGRSYPLRTTLVSAATGMPVVDSNNAPVSMELELMPESSSGSIDIEIPFDALCVDDGDQVVVCEELFEQGRLLVRHWDLLDSAQTVTIVSPTLQTRACDEQDGDSIITRDVEVTILDSVSYAGVVPGKEYLLTGTIIDRTSGKPLEVNGAAVTSTCSFIADASSGTETLSFSFDASDVASGTDLVIFEELSWNGEVLAAHDDPDDTLQTVTVLSPYLETHALDPEDGDCIIAGDIESQLADNVHYKGLAPGREYLLEGRLINKETGCPLLDTFDCPVQVSHAFTPTEREGFTTVVFNFDASYIQKTQCAVVFEELYRDGKRLSEHIDLNCADQSIVIEPPIIQTFASVDGSSKKVMADVDVKIVDAVSYQNLRPDKSYTLKAALMNRRTGLALLDPNGTPITSSLDFTAEQTSGEVQLELAFDASGLQEGDELVVFEQLYRDGVLIAAHEDLDSDRQTVTVSQPTLSTYASSIDDGKAVVRDCNATIIDKVIYTGLAPDHEYEIVGTVMDVKTGEALHDANDSEVSARERFIPTSADDELSLSFAFDASRLDDGHELVVFERLYRNGRLVAAHEDLSDESQAVSIVPVSIMTFACDPADGDKVVASHAQTKVIDAVSYRGLEPGAEYTLVGHLVSVETGEPLLTAQGNPARTSMTLIPQSDSGTIESVFTFDSTNIAQEQDVVIVQELFHGDTLIAQHTDLNNAAQTVTIAPASIDTYATDTFDGDKEIEQEARRSIIDTVSYTGLIPGQEYELHGRIMVNDGTLDGTPLLDPFGSPVETRASFVPSTTHGSIDLTFDIDTSAFMHDTKLVVFETLLSEQAVIAQHEDLQDENQTVWVKTGTPPPPTEPPTTTIGLGGQVFTGDAAATLLFTCSVIGAASLGILGLLRRKAFGSRHR